MNRQERRKLLKERNRLLKKIQDDPMMKIMKPLMESRRGTGQKELLRLLCLGVESHPEPIVVQYMDFSQAVFDEVGNQLLMPTICYEQMADGSIKRVLQNGRDLTELFYQMMEASKKDFAFNGKSYSEAELLIETIKAFNCMIESLGGVYMDTTHGILSHRSHKDRQSDREAMMKYWVKEYKDLRHVFFSDTVGGFHG